MLLNRDGASEHVAVRMRPFSGLPSQLATALEAGLGLADLAALVHEAVAAEVPHSFACVATIDPATGLITWAWKSRPLDVGDEEFAAVEYGEPDVNSFAEIGRRRPPVGVLSIDTAGDLEACRRFREFLHPRFGFTDELRAVFRSRDATWGAIALYRSQGEPAFTPPDAEALAELSEPVANAIQRSLFGADSPPGTAPADPPAAAVGGPAVVIIDAADHVTHMSPASAGAIEELGGWEHGSLPTSLLAVAATARSQPEPKTSRAMTRSGRWLTLNAAALNGPPGRKDVVITIEPTSSAELSRLALAARGLTAREEDVALLVLQGASTRAIAKALFLSPHTVQDHLKAIFAKLGVNSRREMVAQLVLAQP